MTHSISDAGSFAGGLPYNRFGHGPRPLLIFQGLLAEHRPLAGVMLRGFVDMYEFLSDDYTVYLVARRPGLPAGCTTRDLADDYAALVRETFGGAVDVIGVSTGGAVAQHFAADHPELLRRLVLHSSAYRLSDEARVAQMRMAQLARQGRWSAAYAELFGLLLPRRGLPPPVAALCVRLAARMARLALGTPSDPSDMVVTIEAEDRHDCRERLAQIAAPTLVAAGDQDRCYTSELCCATAAGIPRGSLILYRGQAHPASGARFARDVLTFLRAGASNGAYGWSGVTASSAAS